MRRIALLPRQVRRAMRRTFCVAISDGEILCNNVFLSGAVSRASLVRCTSHCVCVMHRSRCCLRLGSPAPCPCFKFPSCSALALTQRWCVQRWPLINALFCVVSFSHLPLPLLSFFFALLTDLQWDITAMQVSDTRVHATYSRSCALFSPNCPLALSVAE